MSNMKRITDYPLVTPNDADSLLLSQNGTYKSTTVENLLEDVNTQLSDLTNNKANKTDLINGSLRIAQRYNASDSTTFTNPSNKYIMDRFRCNGTGTVVPVSGGGCAVTGTINFKYVIEKTDFALFPSTFTLSYGLNGVNNEIVVTKANCAVDSNGNGIIFDLSVTNATLNYVHYGKAPFVPRPYGEELALCKRYLRPLKGLYRSTIKGADNLYFTPQHAIDDMRSVPTLINNGVQSTDWLITDTSYNTTTGWTLTFNGYSIIATKTAHGLSDGLLSIPSANKMFLDSEIY